MIRLPLLLVLGAGGYFVVRKIWGSVGGAGELPA